MATEKLRTCPHDDTIAWCDGECFDCERIEDSLIDDIFSIQDNLTEDDFDQEKTNATTNKNKWSECWKNIKNDLDKLDKVNHPSHYTSGRYETIDIIKDKLTEEQFYGFLCGNVLKYMTRWQHKNGLEDVKKAQWYLTKLIDEKEKKDE